MRSAGRVPLSSAVEGGRAVSVSVPASAANLGPGFDSVGLALGVLDHYRAKALSRPGLVVDLGDDAQGVPADERHLVVSTMRRTWAETGVTPPPGLHLVCRNTIRMGRGMGSSAAAIVAGVALALGLAAVDGEPTDPDARQEPGGPDERAGADGCDGFDGPEGSHGSASAGPSGSDGTDGSLAPVALDLDLVNDIAGALEGHPDNSSASVFGGATISYVDDSAPADSRGGIPRIHTTRLPLHPDVEPVVFLPATQLPTATARAVLPDVVPHRDAALNAARVGLLVHALTHDPALLLPATRDWLHQEQRRDSYPQAMRLVDDLRREGYAAVVSGAGPSVLVLTTTDRARGLTAPGADAGAWQVLRPGVASTGVRAARATLNMFPEERTVAF